MAELKNFFLDFARVYYAPRALYRDLAQKRASSSWICVLLYCLAYVGGALWLYYNIVLGCCILLLLFETAPAAKTEEKISFWAAPVSSLLTIASTGVILFTYIR